MNSTRRRFCWVAICRRPLMANSWLCSSSASASTLSCHSPAPAMPSSAIVWSVAANRSRSEVMPGSSSGKRTGSHALESLSSSWVRSETIRTIVVFPEPRGPVIR